MYQLYAEWADTYQWSSGWRVLYNHYVYMDGYYRYGFPLGHAIGGDGQMYSVGGDIRFDVMNRPKWACLICQSKPVQFSH